MIIKAVALESLASVARYPMHLTGSALFLIKV